MSPEENKALVRRWLDALRESVAPEDVATFFASDFRRHLDVTTPPITAEMHLARMMRLRGAFPDARTTVEDILAEGDRVAFRLTIHGTQTGPFLGAPATGKTVAVPFFGIVRIANGKIAEQWGGLDQADLFRQLGVSAIRDR
jgi:steroid delta-isomerase-like uncharacterized protein